MAPRRMMPAAVVAALLGLSFGANASTTVEYQATCRYKDAASKLRFSGACRGNFGIAGSALNAPSRYLMTFPNGTQITVLTYAHGLALVNGTPAKTMGPGRRDVQLLIGEGEEFTFSSVPDGAL